MRGKLKSFRVVAAPTLVLFLCTFALGQTETPPQAKVTRDQIIDQPRFDFGEVHLGTSAKHKFILNNPTEQPMKIRSVDHSCGCTVSSVSTMEIAPGGACEVTVSLNTKSFRGSKQSTIHVRFDEPKDFEIQLKAAVTIRNFIVEPEPIEFRAIELDKTAHRRIKVTRHGSPFWKITRITTGSANLKGEIVGRKIRGNEVSYEIDCEVLEKSIGQRSDKVTIHSNDTGEPEYAIPVFIEVVKEITASVESIEFDQADLGEKKRFLVKTLKPSEIISLEITPSGMHAELATPGRKMVHMIDVVRKTENQFQGELQIKTDVSDWAITIPVVAEKLTEK